MVEAVRAVLDHLDIQRVLLAGNSLGGMVAARYASKYSKSLAGLILLSPAGAPLSNAELNEIKESFDIKTLSDGSVFVDKVLGRRSVPFGIRHFMGWAARERAARPSVRAILTQADLQMKIQEAELRGIKCPILLVWGEREVRLRLYWHLYTKPFLCDIANVHDKQASASFFYTIVTSSLSDRNYFITSTGTGGFPICRVRNYKFFGHNYLDIYLILIQPI
jgi:pimeloyl-ACP methyl ester carboxylesterase